jgi:hypothetical protein
MNGSLTTPGPAALTAGVWTGLALFALCLGAWRWWLVWERRRAVAGETVFARIHRHISRPRPRVHREMSVESARRQRLLAARERLRESAYFREER